MTGADAASSALSPAGLSASMPASQLAYSAWAPTNCGLVTPYTTSPLRNSVTLAPTRSTLPARSEPSVSGGGQATELRLSVLSPPVRVPSPRLGRVPEWVPDRETRRSVVLYQDTPPRRRSLRCFGPGICR